MSKTHLVDQEFLPTFLDPALDPFVLDAGRVELDVVVSFGKLAEQEKWLRETVKCQCMQSAIL